MELRKSKLLLSLVVAGGLFCSTASFAKEDPEAFGLPDLQGVLDKVKNMLPDPDLKKELCKKGDLSGGKISLRSFNGEGCRKIDFVGAVAAVLCPGVEGYDSPAPGSQCFQKNPYKTKAEGKAKLQEMLNSSGKVKDFLCKNQDKLSNFGDVIPKLVKASCKSPKK